MWMKGAAGCDKIWEDKVRDIKMPKCQSTLAFFYVRNAKVLYTNSFDCIKHFGISDIERHKKMPKCFIQIALIV